MKQRQKIIISCEHGGNHVPREYQNLFRGEQSVLQSHRGMDRGALEFARRLAARLKAPLFAATTTRLLVDLNRSRHHRDLFSEFTRPCNAAVKTKILEHDYYPYRTRVENAIGKIVADGRMALHFSIHTFTPRLGARLRRADIGLLYDPQRPGELNLCRKFQSLLKNSTTGLLVRRNYPYRGTADGFTAYLRKKYNAGEYLGIEIEINQKYAGANNAQWLHIQTMIMHAVELAVYQ